MTWYDTNTRLVDTIANDWISISNDKSNHYRNMGSHCANHESVTVAYFNDPKFKSKQIQIPKPTQWFGVIITKDCVDYIYLEMSCHQCQYCLSAD